jgi:hypothetical protein
MEILLLGISVILLWISIRHTSNEYYAQGYKPPTRSSEYSYNTYKEHDVSATSVHHKQIGFNFGSPNWNFGGPFSPTK